MSDLYTALRVSPRKKRCLPEDDDDILTPKRLRIAPITPPATVSRKAGTDKGPFNASSATPLPSHLLRLLTIQTALQHALSHALATCAMSPSSDTGIVRNVLNHLSISTYTGLTTKFDIDDLRRLVWVWEWNGKALSNDADASKQKPLSDDDENPFLDKPVTSTKDASTASDDDNAETVKTPTKTGKGKSKLISSTRKRQNTSAKPSQSTPRPRTRATVQALVSDDHEDTTTRKLASSETPVPKNKRLAVADDDENPFVEKPRPLPQAKGKASASRDDDENPFLERAVSPVKSSTKGKEKAVDRDDDNPFLESKPSDSAPKDWTRGGMGFIVSQSTHYSKAQGSRVPAYGIGIEVEMDIDKDMGGGMAAVARWTAASEQRRKDFRAKLESWSQLHKDALDVPQIPMATLPPLPVAKQPSTLTRLLASSSPKSPSAAAILARPPSPTPLSRSPTKSPVKRALGAFGLPFPATPSSRTATPSKNSVAFPMTPTSRSSSPTKGLFPFPQTPSTRGLRDSDGFLTPSSTRTPTSSFSDTPSTSSIPSTPVHQRGSDAITAPETPNTSRRAALYERIRQRTMSNNVSPTKTPTALGGRTPKMSMTQLQKLSQEEMRRRCLLGRLNGVAESVWMLFSNPTSSVTSTPSSRKRRALPSSEVAAAIMKSSPVPISSAEAYESIDLLAELCPFFLRKMDIGTEEWLEMPAPKNTDAADSSPSKLPPMPASPGRIRNKDESANEVLTRSPKRVRPEAGGLREVRERIRKELESAE